MKINEKIKQRRIELRLTLEEVANIVGVTKSTVLKWESGQIANMKRDKIKLLANALQTTPAYILGYETSNQTNKDKELADYLEELRTRPEMRMMFSLTKNATKADVEKAVRIIEALLKNNE